MSTIQVAVTLKKTGAIVICHAKGGYAIAVSLSSNVLGVTADLRWK